MEPSPHAYNGNEKDQDVNEGNVATEGTEHSDPTLSSALPHAFMSECL
jgi:hypothetical protein